MSILEEKLKDAVDHAGLARQERIVWLRDYLRVRGDTSIADDIGKLTDPSLFRILFGIGLNSRLQTVTMGRYTFITKDLPQNQEVQIL